MLSSKNFQEIKIILYKLAKGQNVSLKERLYIKNAADQDQKVNSWLRRAKRLQRNSKGAEPIDELLNQLDLDSNEEEVFTYSNPEDLGLWFTGAPSWITRS